MAASCLLMSLLVSACSDLPEGGFSFAAAGSTGTGAKPTEARMNGAEITLAAPRGYCFDKKMLRRDAANGFALLPRCDRLGGGNLFSSLGGGAIITATLGAAPAGVPAPKLSDLAASVPGAQVLDQREDGALPLVKLDMAGHGAKGASSQHWRGAFLLEDHVILLALYAPEDSPLLGPRGAEVLEQMTRLTRAASAPTTVKQATAPKPAATPATLGAPRRTAGGALRPLARPTSKTGATTADQTAPGKKLSLAKRIAGLFD